MSNEITLSLANNAELAELLSDKKAGDRIKLTDVVVLISEKDSSRMSGVVEEVSGDDMYDEESPADESLPSVKVAKGSRDTSSTPESSFKEKAGAY